MLHMSTRDGCIVILAISLTLKDNLKSVPQVPQKQTLRMNNTNQNVMNTAIFLKSSQGYNEYGK